jgi:hypothetical protein
MSLTVKDQPTKDELAERLDFTFELLSRGLHKSEIKKQIRAKYGDLSARTIESYLSRAREKVLLLIQSNKNTVRAESYAFYEAMQRDGNATVREKILARERIDKLLGLDAPTNININHLDKEIEEQLARLGLAEEASLSQETKDDFTADAK